MLWVLLGYKSKKWLHFRNRCIPWNVWLRQTYLFQR